MAHARKGGISHSPGQRFAAPKRRYAPPKQRYAPPRRRFALGRTKAIAPNRPRRTAISRQKMPQGGLAAAFSSLAGGKRDYGAPRGASEPQKKPEKERRARKAAEKPSMGPRMPCWAHAARPPSGVSCHPASKTVQPPLSAKKKPAKRYEHLAGFDPTR